MDCYVGLMTCSRVTQPALLQSYYPLTKAGERFPRYDPVQQPCLQPRPEDDAVFLQGMLEGMANIEVATLAQHPSFADCTLLDHACCR